MPDICMCRNKKCPLKSKCYRFMAVPNQMQTYFGVRCVNGICEYFVEIEKGDRIRDSERIPTIT